MVPTINSAEKATEYAIWYPQVDDQPGEWLCDHSGRVFLFTETGAEVVRRQLDVDPRRPLEIKPYTGDGRVYSGPLLENE